MAGTQVEILYSGATQVSASSDHMHQSILSHTPSFLLRLPGLDRNLPHPLTINPFFLPLCYHLFHATQPKLAQQQSTPGPFLPPHNQSIHSKRGKPTTSCFLLPTAQCQNGAPLQAFFVLHNPNSATSPLQTHSPTPPSLSLRLSVFAYATLRG